MAPHHLFPAVRELRSSFSLLLQVDTLCLLAPLASRLDPYISAKASLVLNLVIHDLLVHQSNGRH